MPLRCRLPAPDLCAGARGAGCVKRPAPVLAPSHGAAGTIVGAARAPSGTGATKAAAALARVFVHGVTTAQDSTKDHGDDARDQEPAACRGQPDPHRTCPHIRIVPLSAKPNPDDCLGCLSSIAPTDGDCTYDLVRARARRGRAGHCLAPFHGIRRPGEPLGASLR
jgi:hypothetical protein